MEFNAYQTPLEDLGLANQPSEVVEQFYDFMTNVPFIQALVAPDRKRARDLPRDEEGKIIVDITHPHILENMEYFTETAMFFQEFGCFTKLRPNSNPNSEFGKWIFREVDRIYNGMVRPEDGEWIPGDLYFFWNYFRMVITERTHHNKLVRKENFPAIWDGHYLKFHYLEQSRAKKKHSAELAARGRGKSYTMASNLLKRFTFGEAEDANKFIRSFVLAYSQEYLDKDGILNKFQSAADFLAEYTQFPSMTLKKSWADLHWKLGYKDLDSGLDKGLQNEVIGVAVASSVEKVRGKRGSLIGIEEFGSFKNLLELYQLILPSVQLSDIEVFGQIMLQGCVCAGTKVWTNDGRNINIEDLKKEDGIIGTDFNNSVQRNVIETKLEPREKECLRISFSSSGGYIECSTDHPILTACRHSHRIEKGTNRRSFEYCFEFKKAEDLKVGDCIVESREVPIFGEERLQDARLIGMLIGDGIYGYDQTPKFSSENQELLSYVKEKYEWGLSASHTTKKGNPYEDIRVKGITQELRRIGIFAQVKKNKRLPVNYQKLTYQDTVDLLAGLFDTDGCIRKKDIVLTQRTREILEEVQILLRKIGIIGSIQVQKARVQEGRLDKTDCYSLVIAGATNARNFYKHIKLLVKYKQEKIKALIDYWENIKVRKEHYDKDKYLFKTISSIEAIGNKITYNLSCVPTHTYLANNIITHNTAGSKESDFSSAQELMYNPDGYNIYSVDNVYDKLGQGKKKFVYFFPAYLCRGGYIGMSGNSDVTAALLSIIKERYRIKYNSSDLNALVTAIAENPITPSEAIMKVKGTLFPVTQLVERLNQIDSDPAFYDDVYCGNLVMKTDGTVEFSPTKDIPIREFPLRDNKAKGCIEIYALPEKKGGKPMANRYIGGIDPVDNDQSGTLSLVSCFILDLWTDTIVAEYTGRLDFADDCYEVIRRMLLFYNAEALYENNLKGLYGYFLKMNCLYLLSDTPQHLKDKGITKVVGIGNTSKGVNATVGVNNYADMLIRDWLLRPFPCVVKTKNELGETEQEERTMPNLYRLQGRALIKELIADDGIINVDRVRALGMLMILREEVSVNLGGDMHRENEEQNDLANDPFFTKNYDDRFKKKPVFSFEETT